MKIKYSENLLFFCEHNMYCSFHFFIHVSSRFPFSYSIISYQTKHWRIDADADAETVFVNQHESSVAIKCHVLNET